MATSPPSELRSGSSAGDWWRTVVVGSVDHERVVARIVEESGWSPRFTFMTIMSAGIAVLGLLPAHLIGQLSRKGIEEREAEAYLATHLRIKDDASSPA